MNNYDLLIQKLDAFTRKYYVNQLMRGTLIFVSCLLIYLLVISVGEYFLYFPSWLKLGILGLLLVAGLSALVLWIIIPLLKIQKLGKIISREQAAKIIGIHFPEVSDKLLNILQLKQNQNSSESRELIGASISQKAGQISLIPFAQAVDLRKNRKYLPYLLAPVAIAAVIFVLAPNIFRDASERLMQPSKDFAPPAPFTFRLTNNDLRVPLYGDYTLEAEVKGDKLPEQVFVQVGAEQLEMQKISKTHYSYTFNRVGQPIDFKLTAASISSGAYKLAVIEKPTLQAFAVSVEYPAYTGKKNEQLQSLNDMSVPAGTVLRWKLQARHTDNISIRLGNTGNGTALVKSGDNEWSGNFRFRNDTAYTLFLSNRQMPRSDSLHYQMQVIPDLHPQVQLQELKDSITGQQVLLTGNASDDYGITRLYFHYTVTDAGKQVVSEKNMPIKAANGNVVPFQQYFDFGSLNLLPGQEVSYYVETWDNDGVNGSKSGRSDVHTYRMFDLKQVDSAMDQNSKQINQGLSSSTEQAKKLQEEMKDLQNQLLQSDNMSWEKQQNMKSMVDKQEQLKSRVESIKKRFEEQKKQSEQKNYSEEIKNKQEAVQKQLDNLLNKELAEQLKKLQEMMKNMNKDNAFQNLQQMEQQNKLFNMDLERIQELMKKLEMQMKMEDLANKLDDLAKREGELKQNTDAQKKANDQLTKDQKDIQQDLKEAMQKDMKELGKLNDAQQKPEKKLDDAAEQGKEADNNMQQSSDQLQQKQQQKASQSQSKAQQNLQQMAASMKQMAGGMDAEQIDIDIKATRQILTNLIRFSFDQEKLMNQVKQTPLSSPAYVTNAQEQNRLKGNAKMIKDSLFSLSKRVFQIAATVNKETTDMEGNINSTIATLEARRLGEAVTRQQYAMTSANNLALLLNELLENLLQSQAQAQSAGNGSCSKPGGMNPKPGKSGNSGQMMKDIITGQQQLGKGMQEGQGKEKGGKQPGGQQGQNGSGQSGGGEGADGENNGDAEQLARLAQQQAALRRQIQELSSMLNSKGLNGNAGELKAIQDAMDKNETDLVNRRLSSQLIQRQKEIMTRLLEAEKSIRDQEEDNKRNANSGKDEQRPMPPELQQYLQSRQSLLDLYKTVPPALKPYYKKMAEDYLKQVKQPAT